MNTEDKFQNSKTDQNFDEATKHTAHDQVTPADQDYDALSEVNTSSTSTQQENNCSDHDAEIASLKDQMLRALAETDNVRRRSEREREDTAKYAITKFARDLLAVSDNLTRAIETFSKDEAEQSEFVNNFAEGIKLTERELHSTLERYGVKKISPHGEKFDHNFHQAMMEIESSDVEAGTVLQVFQIGYTLHDRLLRPAMVGVAKAAS